ncbi:hypothetical protein [Microbacterium amylolyticum]|uniref:DUF5648 domain-containing protein n=1 Tax=Microbacterium amylolyticum TaxID=936337 RepID=A0ABS4ZGH6_9MICO|nr:hypothetical protein [Microbacterium amylolyticum]MBP2436118.1 hypothetical protein [Microbacterium amylolyticum]
MRPQTITQHSVRTRRGVVLLALIGVLAAALVPSSAIAETAESDVVSLDAAEIPTPEDGAYIGSTTQHEADPGGYAEQVDGYGAMSLAGFSAGNIISNAKMYTSGTMSAQEIQRFFNGKVSRCDPKYTCLKDFTQKTVTKKANAYCSGTYSGATRESAATIISKVSRACGVSEKVLIVMLQKEQGLVTHTWPSDWRYDIAMGFACPDDAACDPSYFGFQNQVYMAAYQLQRYTKDPSFNWYPVGKTTQVLWHPNRSCGSGPVHIANDATAALYYYTPYQPNRASLAAGYGAANDPCASYGNRNFYNYYTDWFGPTGGGTGKTPASPNPADSQSVHRFWSPKFDNAHFYTVNAAEAKTLRESDPNWTYQGTDFRVWPVSSGSCRSGTVPVHRFWSSTFASHFFTTNSAEASDIRAGDKNWSYEGIAFCSAPAGSKDTVPVYRFWSDKFRKHFFTANAAEADGIRKNDRNWTYEGVALHAPKAR